MTLDSKMWYLRIDGFKFYKLEVCVLSSVIMFFDDPWHENWILAKFDKWEGLDVSWCETWFLSIVKSKFIKLEVWECALMTLVLKFDNDGWTCQLMRNLIVKTSLNSVNWKYKIVP